VNISLLPTIQSKSDQLNAEDLIGGPITVRVSGVKITESDEQPVWISYDGDNGKPFKPCKTVRRLLVRVWGDDGAAYAGRSMTLYLDQEVKYGGMKVGGIRVSHVSHIDRAQSFYLTETRGKKRQITVNPLQVKTTEPTIEEALQAIEDCETLNDLRDVWKQFAAFQTDGRFEESKDARKAILEDWG